MDDNVLGLITTINENTVESTDAIEPTITEPFEHDLLLPNFNSMVLNINSDSTE